MAFEVINAFENVPNTRTQTTAEYKNQWRSGGKFVAGMPASIADRESHNDLMNYSKHDWKLEINFSLRFLVDNIFLAKRHSMTLRHFGFLQRRVLWCKHAEVKWKITKFPPSHCDERRRNSFDVIRWKQIVWWFLQKIKQFSFSARSEATSWGVRWARLGSFKGMINFFISLNLMSKRVVAECFVWT